MLAFLTDPLAIFRSSGNGASSGSGFDQPVTSGQDETSDHYAAQEVADENGLSVKQVLSTDPHDPRWADFNKRSSEIADTNGGNYQAAGPKAFKEVFGNG